MERRERVPGSTGTVGVDGILTPEAAVKLERLQQETASEGFALLRSHRPGDLFPLAEMATGIGKGRIIHLLIERLMRLKSDARVLLIAGTKNILSDQSHKALAGYRRESAARLVEEEGIDAEFDVEELSSMLYKTGRIGQRGVNVEIGIIQTVQSKEKKGELRMEAYDLVIVDEVHNMGTPQRKALVQKSKRAIGFTATSHRHSGIFKQPEEYGFKIFKSYSLPEAQRDQLLPPLVGVQIDTKEIADYIPTTRLGNIDYPQLERMLKRNSRLRPYIVERLIPIISKPDGTQYKTVIAVNFVWEAKEIADLLYARGIKVGLAVNAKAARDVHSFALPAYQDESIERFRLPHTDRYAVQVLISPRVASEGFDVPPTEVLVWASPTDSELRYAQFIGRLPRRHPGKKYGMVVDYLYQLNKYQWSYNMATLMEGEVRQLPSGILYLGPEEDAQSVSQLPGIRDMTHRKVFDIRSIDTLTRRHSVIEKIQAGDIIVTPQDLVKVFQGNRQRLQAIASRFHDNNRDEHPEYFALRSLEGSGRHKRLVVTALGQEALIAAMDVWHISLRVKEANTDFVDEIPEGGFVLSTSRLSEIFAGKTPALVSQRERALARLRAENTESWDNFVVRVKDTGRTDIITEEWDPFVRAMIAEGAILREKIKPTQETDLILSVSTVSALFRGDSARLSPIVKRIILEMKSDHPEWFSYRMSGTQYQDVITTEEGKAEFIQRMQAAGVKLRPESVEK